MNNDLAKRVADALSEVKVTVKGHTRRSKTGKVSNVKQYERDIKNMSNKELRAEVNNKGPQAAEAYRELSRRKGTDTTKSGEYGYTIGDQNYYHSSTGEQRKFAPVRQRTEDFYTDKVPTKFSRIRKRPSNYK